MSTPTDMTEVVLEAGLWHKNGDDIVFKPVGYNGSVGNSHQFSFTPEPFDLPTEIVEQMHNVAADVPKYYQMLSNMGDVLPAFGVSSQYKGLDQTYWNIPPITMIDAMITSGGDVKVAEVDVVNPRGLGYLALYGQLYEEEVSKAAIDTVASAVLQLGGQLDHLYGSMQTFYLPFYELFKDTLASSGVASRIVCETDIDTEEGILSIDGEAWKPSLLLDFPLLKKVSRKSYGLLPEGIIEAYNQRDLEFLYPPQPHLSSKLLLAAAYEEGVFWGHLPHTQIHNDHEIAQELLSAGDVCIKAPISSGMKGLWLPGDKLDAPKSSPVISQGLVADQMIFDIKHADVINKKWAIGSFLARLSMFVSSDGELLASDLTAQPYEGSIKGVHGNPDCVLTPIRIT